MNDQWQMGLDNLYRQRRSLRENISAIERRCVVEAGEVIGEGRTRVRGYPSSAIRYAKQQRLLVL